MSGPSIRQRLYYRLAGADLELRRVGVYGGSGVPTTLDVGCSDGRGSVVLRGAGGADIHRPTLASARASGERSPVVQADIRRLPFRTSSVDSVVALDVIEHLDKEDALELLEELERVARSRVAVLTPNGFVRQPPSETEPWQEHRCGFSCDELRAHGYEVRGVGGPKALRGDYGSFRGALPGKLLCLLLAQVMRRHPEATFHLFAHKRHRGCRPGLAE